MARTLLRNGDANGHTNGAVNDGNDNMQQNGHPNGHANGLSNGHMNGFANGRQNGFQNGYANGHPINGIPNGHANGYSNGIQDDHTKSFATGFSSSARETPVAICGMAMRLPAGIHNDKDLYKFLFEKGDARSTIGEDRYSIDGYYSPYGQHGTINTTQGYFLSDLDYSNLDLSMFTFSAAEAEQLDPNHRLVLEMVREAFESAGESEWREKNIGTYDGLFVEDWQEIGHRDNQAYNAQRILGGTDFALPNRIAYEYDLKGPR